MVQTTVQLDSSDLGGAPGGPMGRLSAASLRWSGRLLVAVTWLSGAIFAAYIVAFFGGVAIRGAAERWNESLPGLHDAAAPLATAAIGAHFLAGGILLLLGPIQLIGAVRRRAPAFHRWLGRTYVVSAGIAGVGGLAFIFGSGTIGGRIMDIGFGLYGVLMILCAVQAYRHARGGRYDQHRAWAIRLFALTVGSWLYRMEYAAWHVFLGDLGRGPAFSGWFDAIMVFFFYVPNLIVAELFIRARRTQGGRAGQGAGLGVNLGASAVLLAASGFVVLATVLFTTNAWIPGMVSGVVGGPR